MELKLTRPLVIFDLETTGVNVGSDRIVEICMVKIMPDKETETIYERINPTIPIPPVTTAIHGISDEDVKDKPTFKERAKEFDHFLNGCDLSGYNSNKFDIPLLVEEFLRAEINFDLKGRRFVDVQNIFHKMEPRTLKAAYRFYCNKDLTDAHDARADTMATYEVLKAQLDQYEDVEIEDENGKKIIPIKNDVQALHDFSYNSRAVDLVGHIVYNNQKVEVFNFGKYKGKSVETIFEKEPSYFDWMMKSDFPLSTKRVIQLIKLRGFNKGSVNINQ
ncbi:exonuclease domain-containing protein [Bacteroidota bacterium]